MLHSILTMLIFDKCSRQLKMHPIRPPLRDLLRDIGPVMPMHACLTAPMTLSMKILHLHRLT